MFGLVVCTMKFQDLWVKSDKILSFIGMAFHIISVVDIKKHFVFLTQTDLFMCVIISTGLVLVVKLNELIVSTAFIPGTIPFDLVSISTNQRDFFFF